MITTMELVKRSALLSKVDSPTDEHMGRLSKLTGINYSQSEIILEEQQILNRLVATSSFPLVVSRNKIIKNFKYAASIAGGAVRYFGFLMFPIDIQYIGDIPDFAITRANDALSLYGIRYITIHSNKRLPIALALSDPVIIGWLSPPCIKVTKSGKTRGAWTSDILGVVIAIWSEDGTSEI